MPHHHAVSAIMLGALLAAAPVSARPSRKSDEARVAVCIERAAAGRSWLAKTLWGLRDQEGGWIGAQVPNANGTFDLGPLQINSSWVPRIASLVGRTEADVAFWLRYDACFNAEAARWIFLSALQMSGDYWQAIGIYHSPTRWRQRRYVLRVAAHLKRRFGNGIFLSSSPGTRPVR